MKFIIQSIRYPLEILSDNGCETKNRTLGKSILYLPSKSDADRKKSRIIEFKDPFKGKNTMIYATTRSNLCSLGH